jgi:valyl-tRNA synthetase
MQKNYDHNGCEDELYESWEKSGKMRADAHSAKKPFTIPLPPPNVTGQLHLGHAAMLAIEDILIRYKKMTNHEVCWLPGTDHAAIATENVVLKSLNAKSREEYSREEFMDHCRQFAGEKHDRIVSQMKKMGAWLDWSRESYTFDEPRNHAVIHMFKDLYDAGLIERGYRMINWSAGAQSVISDDELEWDEIKEPFYYIQCGEFIIGTVRSETKCANSPLMVHPTGEYVRVKFSPLNEGELKGESEKIFILSKNLFEDEERRNKVLNLLPEGTFEVLATMPGNDLVGQSFEYDTFAGKRKFHVLADEIIDIDKGSGSMTISASHSADDYDLAKRLGLKDTFIHKIDFEGNMTDIAGECAGMPVIKARRKSAQIMKEMGLLVGEDKTYQHRVPKCYRSNCVIEPMISPQWFVMVEKKFTDKFTGKETTLKAQMQEAVRGGHVKIIPERFEKTYFQWIDNLRDWCISRQIWWGHQIPVWYDEDNNVHLAEEKTVYLFRHGQSLDGKAGLVQNPESPLTDEAKKNLLEQIADLREKNITKIVTSSYKRATETAEIIANALNIEIEVKDELRGFGYGEKFAGQPREDVFGSNNDPADFADFLAKNKLPDTVDGFFKRLNKAWQSIKKTKTDGNILVVSHRTALTMLDLVLDGKKATDFAHARVKNTSRPASTIWREQKIFCEPKVPVPVDTNCCDAEKNKDIAKSTTVLWARHGQSEANRDKLFQGKLNSPLTEQGINDAKKLAASMTGRNIVRIIASPLQRANNTAQIVAEKLGLTVETWDDLFELDQGDLAGKSQSLAGDTPPIQYALENETGESIETFYGRAQAIWKKIRSIKDQGEVLIVAHGLLGSALLAVERNIKADPQSFETFRQQNQLENGEAKKIYSTASNQVFAIRHGQSVSNIERDYLHVQSEHPLTELGQSQVRTGAKNLAGRKIGAIIASPLKRTQQTASIVAEECGFTGEIITLPELIELGVGEHEGKEIVPPENKSDLFRKHLPDGQSVEELTNNAKKIAEFVRNLNVDGDIILVTHFGRMSSLLEYQKNGSIDSAFFDEIDDRYHIGNAGIVNLDLTPKTKKLRQEEDTLDTWFSSALWPMSPLGYPNTESPDFQKFYPSDVLETGWDIIFFWVARMIMFGRFATGKYPFHTVYLHGLVCDEKGKKMSKSKGNGIDPIEVIEEVGADAVRLSLVIGTTPGNNIPIGKNKIKGYRNFVNKLWNAGRFVQMNMENVDLTLTEIKPITLADKWILARFSTVAAEVAQALETFQISTAGNKIYHFVWDEFCAWYLEAFKAEQSPKFLVQLFREILKLTHPICPYITEHLWSELFPSTDGMLVLEQDFPSVQFNDPASMQNFAFVQEAVTELRRVRADQGINPKDTIKYALETSVDISAQSLIELLAKVASVTTNEMPDNAAMIQVSGAKFLVDFPIDEAKLARQKAELEKKIVGLKGRLSNKKYVDNAPEKLVNETRAQLKEAEEKLAAMS